MQKLSVEEVQQIQLSILENVAQFCEDNQIGYWLDYGTLLGGVRHKGYIPWDDDIDIGMLRTDYENFMKTFNIQNKKYKFYCPENNASYIYPFGKVIDTDTILYEPDIYGSKFAVNIDVFVYDDAPRMQIAYGMYKKVKWLLLLNMLQHNLIADKGKLYKKAIKKVASGILKMFPYNYFNKKIANNAKKYAGTESEYIGCFVWSDRFLCKKKVVASFINIEFEGKVFKAPKEYDYWLTKLYGNYMELPPVEERVTHHVYEAYLK